MDSESSHSMSPLPVWERHRPPSAAVLKRTPKRSFGSVASSDAIRVRGFALTIDRDPSPQPSPTRRAGAHHRCGDIEPFHSKLIQTWTMRLWLVLLFSMFAAAPPRAQERFKVVPTFLNLRA